MSHLLIRGTSIIDNLHLDLNRRIYLFLNNTGYDFLELLGTLGSHDKISAWHSFITDSKQFKVELAVFDASIKIYAEGEHLYREQQNSLFNNVEVRYIDVHAIANYPPHAYSRLLDFLNHCRRQYGVIILNGVDIFIPPQTSSFIAETLLTLSKTHYIFMTGHDYFLMRWLSLLQTDTQCCFTTLKHFRSGEVFDSMYDLDTDIIEEFGKLYDKDIEQFKKGYSAD